MSGAYVHDDQVGWRHACDLCFPRPEAFLPSAFPPLGVRHRRARAGLLDWCERVAEPVRIDLERVDFHDGLIELDLSFLDREGRRIPFAAESLEASVRGVTVCEWPVADSTWEPPSGSTRVDPAPFVLPDQRIRELARGSDSPLRLKLRLSWLADGVPRSIENEFSIQAEPARVEIVGVNGKLGANDPIELRFMLRDALGQRSADTFEIAALEIASVSVAWATCSMSKDEPNLLGARQPTESELNRIGASLDPSTTSAPLELRVWARGRILSAQAAIELAPSRTSRREFQATPSSVRSVSVRSARGGRLEIRDFSFSLGSVPIDQFGRALTTDSVPQWKLRAACRGAALLSNAFPTERDPNVHVTCVGPGSGEVVLFQGDEEQLRVHLPSIEIVSICNDSPASLVPFGRDRFVFVQEGLGVWLFNRTPEALELGFRELFPVKRFSTCVRYGWVATLDAKGSMRLLRREGSVLVTEDVRRPRSGEFVHVAFEADGTFLCAGGSRNEVYAWSVDGGRLGRAARLSAPQAVAKLEMLSFRRGTLGARFSGRGTEYWLPSFEDGQNVLRRVPEERVASGVRAELRLEAPEESGRSETKQGSPDISLDSLSQPSGGVVAGLGARDVKQVALVARANHPLEVYDFEIAPRLQAANRLAALDFRDERERFACVHGDRELAIWARDPSGDFRITSKHALPAPCNALAASKKDIVAVCNDRVLFFSEATPTREAKATLRVSNLALSSSGSHALWFDAGGECRLQKLWSNRHPEPLGLALNPTCGVISEAVSWMAVGGTAGAIGVLPAYRRYFRPMLALEHSSRPISALAFETTGSVSDMLLGAADEAGAISLHRIFVTNDYKPESPDAAQDRAARSGDEWLVARKVAHIELERKVLALQLSGDCLLVVSAGEICALPIDSRLRHAREARTPRSWRERARLALRHPILERLAVACVPRRTAGYVRAAGATVDGHVITLPFGLEAVRR